MKTFIAAALVAIVFAEEEAAAEEAVVDDAEAGPAKTEWSAVAKDTASGQKFSLDGAYWVGDDAAGASALHITSTIDGPKQTKTAGVGYGVWASIPELGIKVLTEEEKKAMEEAAAEPVEEVEVEETEEVEVEDVVIPVYLYDEVAWIAHVTIADDKATATDIEVHSRIAEDLPAQLPVSGLQAEGGRWAVPTVAAALSEDGKSTSVTFDSSRAMDHEDMPLHGGFEHWASVGFGIGADVAEGATAVGSGFGSVTFTLPGDGAMALAATGLAASATMALLM